MAYKEFFPPIQCRQARSFWTNKELKINAGGLALCIPTRHEFEVLPKEKQQILGELILMTTVIRLSRFCVIPHLYHVIQGARYQTSGRNAIFNPYTMMILKPLGTMYIGWARVGLKWPVILRSAAAGGGHAHAGAMIYLGREIHGPKNIGNTSIFMNNINGLKL